MIDFLKQRSASKAIMDTRVCQQRSTDKPLIGNDTIHDDDLKFVPFLHMTHSSSIIGKSHPIMFKVSIVSWQKFDILERYIEHSI